MTKNRIEAFTDGVIAILITIMVLELRPPDGTGIGDLHDLVPKVGAYLLSFVLIGIYWNNHHHLYQLVERVDGAVMWSNLALLFCLSLVPLVTAWFGDHPGAEGPVFWYGVVGLSCAVAYGVMTVVLVRLHDADSKLARAVGADRKGRFSIVAYCVAIALAPALPWPALAIVAATAIVWLIPDRRMARLVES